MKLIKQIKTDSFVLRAGIQTDYWALGLWIGKGYGPESLRNGFQIRIHILCFGLVVETGILK